MCCGSPHQICKQKMPCIVQVWYLILEKTFLHCHETKHTLCTLGVACRRVFVTKKGLLLRQYPVCTNLLVCCGLLFVGHNTYMPSLLCLVNKAWEIHDLLFFPTPGVECSVHCFYELASSFNFLCLLIIIAKKTLSTSVIMR